MMEGTPEESKASIMPVLEEFAPFDPTRKKKKKKKPILCNHVHDPILSIAKTAENLSISEGFDFSDYGAEEVTIARQYPWEGTDRDYTYGELLGRLFHTLHENNPEIAEDRPRTILRPPQVLQEGTSRTVIANFMDYCKRMHRQPEHVTSFVLDELGAGGSLDGQQRLVLKGRFSSTCLEEILGRYISQYVLCSCCRSPDTAISKEKRYLFLGCEQCGTERCVGPINSSYTARVERRTTRT